MTPTPPIDHSDELTADCASCFGLCCVALPFARSADFAIDKAGGEPCPNLGDDNRCGIHGQLRTSGFLGCVTFDCMGAGQRVSRLTFAGRDWRRDTGVAAEMFGSFSVMHQLHEMLWYLREAISRTAASSLLDELEAEQARVRQLTCFGAEDLLAIDTDEHRSRIGKLLAECSSLVRGDDGLGRLNRTNADLMGSDLRGAVLRDVNLRGAYLIGANLQDSDLRRADLLGADLRNADVTGADLSTTLFLTQTQVNATRGDSTTRVPHTIARPAHWSC